jgi:hypothetical protein
MMHRLGDVRDPRGSGVETPRIGIGLARLPRKVASSHDDGLETKLAG